MGLRDFFKKRNKVKDEMPSREPAYSLEDESDDEEDEDEVSEEVEDVSPVYDAPGATSIPTIQAKVNEDEDADEGYRESVQDRINRVKSGKMTDEEKQAFLQSVLSTGSKPETRKPLRMSVSNYEDTKSKKSSSATPFPADSILRDMASGKMKSSKPRGEIRAEEVKRVSAQKQKREYLDRITDPNRFKSYGVINPLSVYSSAPEKKDSEPEEPTDDVTESVPPQATAKEPEKKEGTDSLADRLEAEAYEKEKKRKQTEAEKAKKLEEERRERERKLQEIAQQRREEQRRREAIAAEQMRKEEEEKARTEEEKKRKEKERLELMMKKQEEYWTKKLAEEKKLKAQLEAERAKQAKESKDEKSGTSKEVFRVPTVERKPSTSPSFNPDESKLLDEAEEERKEIKLENESITNKAAGLGYKEIHPTLKESKLQDKKKKDDDLLNRLKQLNSPLPSKPDKKVERQISRPVMQEREKTTMPARPKPTTTSPPTSRIEPREIETPKRANKDESVADMGWKNFFGGNPEMQDEEKVPARTKSPPPKPKDATAKAPQQSTATKSEPIRMELPLIDDDDEDDDFDAKASGGMSIADVMRKKNMNSGSQEERSKKWGIDMSKFT